MSRMWSRHRRSSILQILQSVDQDGYYTYDQVIVVNDDTAPEIDAPVTFVVNTSGGAES